MRPEVLENDPSTLTFVFLRPRQTNNHYLLASQGEALLSQLLDCRIEFIHHFLAIAKEHHRLVHEE